MLTVSFDIASAQPNRGDSPSQSHADRFRRCPLYTALLGRLDEALYRRNRKRFILEIERAFSRVMKQHGGRIVPGEGEELTRAFDYVALTVEFIDLRLRLIR